MNRKTFLIAAGLLLSLNSQAEKVEPISTCNLTTPALWAIAPNVFTCSLTNVTSTNHKVRIRIINSEGVTLKDSAKISLAAKHTKGLDNEGLPEGGGYMYCEFTVDGHKEEYRGVAKMYHANNGSDFIAIAAE